MPRAPALVGSATLLMTLIAVAAPGHAQTRPREGTVVALDNGDLVVDLGTSKGAHDGEIVELWRPVRLRHPVTGAVLVDRFKIGSVRLTQVQGTLSLANLEGKPLRAVATGDVVVMTGGEPAPTAVAAPASASAPTSVPVPVPGSASAHRPAPPPANGRPAAGIVREIDDAPAVADDPDARALSDLVVSLSGATPQARIAAYEAFVREHPHSRYAAALNEEAASLRANAVVRPAVVPYRLAERPLERARPGVPQRIALELDPRLGGAVLHARRRGTQGYRSVPMESVGARYWSAVLPGDVVSEPGMEYFIEGVPANGHAVAISGTADQPRDVRVEPAPIAGKSEETTAQAWIQSEYASFNAKRANDFVWQTEAALGWRLRDVGLRAVRSGFGVVRGKGGTLDELDRLGRAPKDIGLSYGWLEAEIALSPTFALIGRPILGLKQGGMSGGAQGFARVGDDRTTNLLVGGEVLGQVGMRGIVELDWRTIAHVPIMLRTEVTTQPAGIGGDVGARAIAQVGYEIARDFTVAARGSYQGRTIDHSGPGAGLAVSYQW
jgi:hypothetical protein